MKKIFATLLIVFSAFCVSAQVYSKKVDVKTDIIAKIIVNTTKAITPDVMKKILIGLWDYDVDTMYTSGTYLYYRRGGIWFHTPIPNAVDTTNKFVTNIYRKAGTDSVFFVKGTVRFFAYIDSSGAGGGGGGADGNYNFNIGAGFRAASPYTPNIRTFFPGAFVNIDSTSNSNGLTWNIDTNRVHSIEFYNGLYWGLNGNYGTNGSTNYAGTKDATNFNLGRNGAFQFSLESGLNSIPNGIDFVMRKTGTSNVKQSASNSNTTAYSELRTTAETGTNVTVVHSVYATGNGGAGYHAESPGMSGASIALKGFQDGSGAYNSFSISQSLNLITFLAGFNSNAGIKQPIILFRNYDYATPFPYGNPTGKILQIGDSTGNGDARPGRIIAFSQILLRTSDSLAFQAPLKFQAGNQILHSLEVGSMEFTKDSLYLLFTSRLRRDTMATKADIRAIAGGGPATMIVGSSPITSGTPGYILYDNGGNLGELPVTGTAGNVVLSTSPILTTPNLGTPSALTLTNATGLPLATGVTGILPGTNGGTGINNGSKTLTISGNTTIGSSTNTVAFATSGNTSVTLPASGTLATLAGSETLTNKTLVAPILGTPASGTLTNATGLPLATGVTGVLPLANGGTNNASLSVTAGTIYFGDGTKVLGLAPGSVNQTLYGGSTPQWKNADTTALFTFGGGGGNAGDTSSFATTSIYGSFFNTGDTLNITKMDIGLQGTSASVTVTVYYNDSLNVTAGATKLVNAGSAATNLYTGTSVTSFDNVKIPPGVWVWCKTTTVTTKPTYLSVSLAGYKIRP